MKITRRQALVLLACLTLAVLFVVPLLTSEREPCYKGRTLSRWWDLRTAPEASPAVREESAEAIRKIGTNALPFLLRGMRDEASHPRSRNLPLLLRLIPSHIAANKTISRLISVPVSQKARGIFVVLGPQASPAVPELAALLDATNNADIIRDAAYCLAAIGPAGVPPLIDALNKPQLPCCREAALILGRNGPTDETSFALGTNVVQAVPKLAKLASAKDSTLAKAAIKALGHIRMLPETALPAITNSLASTDPAIRQASIRALARFGAAASMLPALNDADEAVRRTATNCLSLIAPLANTSRPAQ